MRYHSGKLLVIALLPSRASDPNARQRCEAMALIRQI